ncbi:MAG: hypothetical protein ACAF41_20065 [Leptolyngbya sp. BL-A-14]
MKIKQFFSILVILIPNLLVLLPAFAEHPSAIEPYLGEWKIASYEQRGLSAALTPKYASGQIGKKMRLSASKASFDARFLWFRSCNAPTYKWAKPADFQGNGWQALLPTGHPKKRSGSVMFLLLSCSGRLAGGFEVARNHQLVAYYDSFYFYLDKQL